MNTKMLRKARALWASGDRRLDRHNQRAWARAIRLLGDKWLLARHQPRTGGAK
jgi:hypothetical protein